MTIVLLLIHQINDTFLRIFGFYSIFKLKIQNNEGNTIIKVSHGETVTVRVPTHKDGSALFWEFATDHYDIAFGLFFEWTETEETEVSVHISDSEDEDLDDDYHDDEDVSGDPENATRALVEKGPPTSVIVPIFRRDCHTEVYAGTHNYPGRGVYLLKFDNTYSLWRSKTLYYRKKFCALFSKVLLQNPVPFSRVYYTR